MCFDADPAVLHDQSPGDGDELDGRWTECLGQPFQESPTKLRALDETRWHQVGSGVLKKLGTFDCSSKYIVKNTGSVIGTPLNAQRYATQYATSSVIKPQG